MVKLFQMNARETQIVLWTKLAYLRSALTLASQLPVAKMQIARLTITIPSVSADRDCRETHT